MVFLWCHHVFDLPPVLVEARLEIEALYDGVDFSETLTRARFEAGGGLLW